MTNCTTEAIQFPGCKQRRVEAEFSGGNVSSDGGVLLLRQADRVTGLTEGLPKASRTLEGKPVVTTLYTICSDSGFTPLHWDMRT